MKQFHMALVLSLCLPSTAAFSQDVDVPPKQWVTSPHGVLFSNGKFTMRVTDLSVGPLTLERRRHGGKRISPPKAFGEGWTHNFEMYVEENYRKDSTYAQVVLGDKSNEFYKRTSVTPTVYVQNDSDAHGTELKLVSGAFVFRDREGAIYTFNASVPQYTPYSGRLNQKIASILYPDGHRLEFTYSSGKLVRVTSNRGYALVFVNGAHGNVSEICGYNLAVTALGSTANCAGAALKTAYSYTNTGGQLGYVLTSVTDVKGNIWGYTISDMSYANITCVKQVNSSNCAQSMTYGASGRISQVDHVTTPDGSVWEYHYNNASDEEPRQPWMPPTFTYSVYYGPQGTGVGAFYYGGLLDTITEYGGSGPSRTTQYSWNGRDPVSVTYPEGNVYGYAIDSWGRDLGPKLIAKPGSGIPTISGNATYPAATGDHGCAAGSEKICYKPITRTDVRGYVTDYTYDSAHGGVLTETGPAVGGIRPQTRNGYQPLYAYYKNSAGSYVAAATPIWLLTSTSICRTSAASGAGCTTAGDEVVTTYDYGPASGPNNLLLRGVVVTADGTSLRTCYGYDWQGNRVSETKPKAGLTSCP